MRDPKRIDEVLALLGELWHRYPDLRLGQIIVNAANPTQSAPEIFYLEDEMMAERLRGFIAERSN